MRAAILFVFYVASPLANICPLIYILCSLDAFPTPIYPPSPLPPSSLTPNYFVRLSSTESRYPPYQRGLNSKRGPSSFPLSSLSSKRKLSQALKEKKIIKY
jgi:hypothetical protein